MATVPSLVSLIFLSFVVLGCVAQSPGSYDPNAYFQSKCEAYGGVPNTCTDFVDANIWVPTNYTQAKIQQEVANYATIDTIVSAIPSPSCKALFLKSFCGNVFRRCYSQTVKVPYNNTQINIVFGEPVCKSQCQATVDACRTIFQQAGIEQYLPNCSYTVDNYPVYPDVSLTLTVFNTTLTVPCYLPPGPNGLCIDAGIITICAGSALTSPFHSLFALFEEYSVMDYLSSVATDWLSFLV